MTFVIAVVADRLIFKPQRLPASASTAGDRGS
jgi:hypothetical protein